MMPTQLAGVGWPQAMSGKVPSSTMPLQSSSQPLHTSGEGTQLPHTPPSSMKPSQSSSSPLQISVEGQWAGLPQVSTSSSTWPSQLLSTMSQVSWGL
jgi:hypothetical protein